MMPPLARSCLQHLRDEEAALRELHATLNELRSALLAGDAATIARLVQRQIELADAEQAIAQARESFRHAAALELGLPAELVTIRQVMARTPQPWADEIRAAHERLLGLRAQNRELGQRIAATLACCRSFTRSVLARLTGTIDRYGPTGARVGVPA